MKERKEEEEEKRKNYSIYSILSLEWSRFHNNAWMIAKAPVLVKPVFCKLELRKEIIILTIIIIINIINNNN